MKFFNKLVIFTISIILIFTVVGCEHKDYDIFEWDKEVQQDIDKN